MRILFLGDLVGQVGRQAAVEALPMLIESYGFDFVIVNGENAAAGFGITEDIAQDVFDAGADVITLGNHAFDKRQALVFIERMPNLLRPLNYPIGAPGRGAGLFEGRNGHRVMVMNPMGRVYMETMDDPFAAVVRQLDACPLGEVADAIIIDFHGEATSEKQALAHYIDGRASMVVGTHTHVPTADERILPHGTAYMSDAGMCGDYASILGMDIEEPIRRFVTKIPAGRFEPAQGKATLCGVFLQTDDKTGLAQRIDAFRRGAYLKPTDHQSWKV